MRAAVIEKPGSYVVKEIERPVPKKDEVLIRVDSASICNATDGHIYHGVFDGYHDFYPQIMGHEIAGEVIEAGEDVTELRPGELIAEYTPRGAFCEYAIVRPKEDLWVRVPKSIPLRARSLVEMFHGAYVSTVYPAEITREETVLVVGQGPMGLTVTAGAKLTAKKVIVTDFYQNRLDKALEMGADVALNRSQMSADEVVKRVLEETDNKGADVVIMAISEDRSENSDAYDMAIAAMRYRGRMTGLLVDVKGIGKNQRINPRQLLRKEARFQHTLNPVYRNHQDELNAFQGAVDAVAAGKINLEKLITHEIGLEDLEEEIGVIEEV